MAKQTDAVRREGEQEEPRLPGPDLFEWLNALATCSFCCTASFLYKKMHTKKGAVLGLACGVVCLVGVMLLWNYLVPPSQSSQGKKFSAGFLLFSLALMVTFVLFALVLAGVL